MKKYLLIFCVLFSFCACHNGRKESSSASLQELKLGAMSSMDYIPFVIAQKQGIYDSLGLKVDIVKFFSANDRDAAFQSGNLDGTIIDFTGAIIQHAHGIGLKVVMKNDGVFYLIAGKDTKTDSISQLRGKNIAVSRNTVIEFATDKVLEKAGIKESEVNKPEINKIPLRMEMLENKQIDASIFPDPFATMAKENGHASLVNTKEMDISITGTIFTEKAIKEKNNEIAILIQGYNLAVDYMKKYPVKEWMSVLTEDVGVPQSLVGKVALPDYRYASLPAEKEIMATVQWLKKKGLIEEEYTGDQLLDSAFTQPTTSVR